ncbi:hypothetical protein [Psychroserpens sp. NJDZ02]|uniref:hypothetical protein n=1 Tax=Psychroserpens sp. NJDZ02 TaxID=2570561 RepID=UPI0010A7BB9F|nr:hypothetical protein [Psychroserpens sp. NJDZ02]QCE40760.1 hypothetical protein E9099_04780 [Psychroserpens sp. NJDZ02]
MKWLIKTISVVFHPIIMPLLAIHFYFKKSPRFIPEDLVYAKLISLFILSVVLPIMVYFLLKTLGKTESIHLKTTKERILPLLVNCAIIILILYRVFPENQIPELYFFFIGILLSSVTCLILAILKFKASIHLIATGGVFMFFIAFAIHFSININGSLALFAIITGAVATSRLYLEAHSVKELLAGLLIGIIPQLIVLQYWL